MANYVHILLKTDKEEIGDIVRRIAVGYAQYHNIKNGRTGHLFQNRFKSEPVENDKYFLTFLRYIHQNPVKAGLVKYIEDYKWSSYNEYIDEPKLIDPLFALSFFNDIEKFYGFMKEKNDDKCLEYNPRKRYTDKGLKDIISSFININKLDELDKDTRNKVLRKIKVQTEASNR